MRTASSTVANGRMHMPRTTSSGNSETRNTSTDLSMPAIAAALWPPSTNSCWMRSTSTSGEPMSRIQLSNVFWPKPSGQRATRTTTPPSRTAPATLSSVFCAW